MKRGIYFFLVLLLAACTDAVKNKVDIKSQFDLIDGITGVDNWKWIHGADTSYVYFSRQGDQKINVYHFGISKGDSVNSELNAIIPMNDTITWSWNSAKWMLVAASDSSMSWAELGSPKTYSFKKIDSTHIVLSSAIDHTNDTLVKTLPLSTFLVRAKYDYEHNTSQVDSALIPSRTPIK